MYRNILIATDGSQTGERAVTHGLGMARSTGAAVTVVTVTERFPTRSGVLMPTADDVIRYEGLASASARKVLDPVRATAETLGIACQTRHIKDSEPADGILAVCREGQCDLVVMATHGRRGLDRLLLGSQTAKVMAGTALPVLVCR